VVDQTDGEWDIADDNFAIGAMHAAIIERGCRWELVQDVGHSHNAGLFGIGNESSDLYGTKGIQSFFQFVILELILQDKLTNVGIGPFLDITGINTGRSLLEGCWITADGSGGSGLVEDLAAGLFQRRRSIVERSCFGGSGVEAAIEEEDRG
jgi:hypothetical protein